MISKDIQHWDDSPDARLVRPTYDLRGILSRISSFLLKARGRVLVGAAALAIAPAGGFAESAMAATPSAASTSCNQIPNIMGYQQAGQAIHAPLPGTNVSILDEAYAAVVHAGPNRHATYPPGGPLAGAREVDAYYRARINGARRLGTYVFQVVYNGRLTPNDIKSVELTEVPTTFGGAYWRSRAQFVRNEYDFNLSWGDFEDEGPRGREWWISVDYGQTQGLAGYYALYSALAGGGVFNGSALTINTASLSSVGSQFLSVAKEAEAHRPLGYQTTSPVLKAERRCPG